MNQITALLLQVNGWTAVLIGSTILFDPILILSSFGFPPDPSAGVLSELRAPGGLLLACGVVIIRRGLNSDHFLQGLQLSIMVYGGYGGARLLAFALDGLPPVQILVASGAELLLCVLSILVMQKLQQKNHYSIA